VSTIVNTLNNAGKNETTTITLAGCSSGTFYLGEFEHIDERAGNLIADTKLSSYSRPVELLRAYDHNIRTGQGF